MDNAGKARAILEPVVVEVAKLVDENEKLKDLTKKLSQKVKESEDRLLEMDAIKGKLASMRELLGK